MIVARPPLQNHSFGGDCDQLHIERNVVQFIKNIDFAWEVLHKLRFNSNMICHLILHYVELESDESS